MTINFITQSWSYYTCSKFVSDFEYTSFFSDLLFPMLISIDTYGYAIVNNYPLKIWLKPERWTAFLFYWSNLWVYLTYCCTENRKAYTNSAVVSMTLFIKRWKIFGTYIRAAIHQLKPILATNSCRKALSGTLQWDAQGCTCRLLLLLYCMSFAFLYSHWSYFSCNRQLMWNSVLWFWWLMSLRFTNKIIKTCRLCAQSPYHERNV